MIRVPTYNTGENAPNPKAWEPLNQDEQELMDDHGIDHDDLKQRLAAVASESKQHTHTDEKLLCRHTHLLLVALRRERRERETEAAQLARMAAELRDTQAELLRKNNETTIIRTEATRLRNNATGVRAGVIGNGTQQPGRLASTVL